MTNIIVKNTASNDPDDRREGMIRAGEQINDFILDDDEPAARDFFNDLFKELRDDDDPNATYRLFYKDEAEHRLRRTRKADRYRLVGSRRRLVVKCKADADEGTSGDHRMTIGVPAERQEDLLDGGYIDTIIDDLNALLTAPVPPSTVEENLINAKKYLLASIFLNRCQ